MFGFYRALRNKRDRNSRAKAISTSITPGKSVYFEEPSELSGDDKECNVAFEMIEGIDLEASEALLEASYEE